MKLKSIVIAVIIIVFFLPVVGTTIHAQGIYSNDNQAITTTTTPVNNGGGIYRAGEDGTDGPGAPGPSSDPEPIGEGVFILSLLAGGYALLKKNLRKKHED